MSDIRASELAAERSGFRLGGNSGGIGGGGVCGFALAGLNLRRNLEGDMGRNLVWMTFVVVGAAWGQVELQDAVAPAALRCSVRAANGNALQGVKVEILEVRERGVHQVLQGMNSPFDVKELPDGVYDVQFEAEGYLSTAVRRVVVRFPETQALEVRMNPVPGAEPQSGAKGMANVFGRLQNAKSGKLCFQSAAVRRCAVVNTLGQYRIELKPGVYEVTLEREVGGGSFGRREFKQAGWYADVF